MSSAVTSSFCKLVVNDLDMMATFYENALDLKPQRTLEGEVAGLPIGEVILVSDTGVMLILFKWLDQPVAPRDGAIYVLNTPDIHALFERAVAAGARVRQTPGPPKIVSSSVPMPDTSNVVIGYLEDPEGRLIQVVEQAG